MRQLIFMFTCSFLFLKVNAYPAPKLITNVEGNIASLINSYNGKEIVEQKEKFENSIENIKKHIEYHTLANGGKYALLEKSSKGDKVTASLVLQYGNQESLSGKSETGTLMAAMIKAGTTTRTKKQITEELNKIKTTIYFYEYAGRLQIQMLTDRKNLEAALNLLTDLLENPKFDNAEFNKLWTERKRIYESTKQDPQTVCASSLANLTTNYPKGHPLYISSKEEKLEELSKVTLEDLKKYYNNFYGANNSLSVFVGEIDKKQVSSFLEKTFSRWNSKWPFSEIVAEYYDVKSITETVQIPGKTYAALAGNVPLQLSQKDPDYAAVMTANNILGGGRFKESRFATQLIEKNGMSDNAASYSEANYKTKQGAWGFGASFNPLYKNRLDSTLHEVIEKAISNGFTRNEMKRSVKSMLNNRKTLLDSDNYLVYLVVDYMRDGRDLRDFTDFENKTKALKLSDVNAAMKKYFDMSRLVIVYAGDFNKK